MLPLGSLFVPVVKLLGRWPPRWYGFQSECWLANVREACCWGSLQSVWSRLEAPLGTWSPSPGTVGSLSPCHMLVLVTGLVLPFYFLPWWAPAGSQWLPSVSASEAYKNFWVLSKPRRLQGGPGKPSFHYQHPTPEFIWCGTFWFGVGQLPPRVQISGGAKTLLPSEIRSP